MIARKENLIEIRNGLREIGLGRKQIDEEEEENACGQVYFS